MVQSYHKIKPAKLYGVLISSGILFQYFSMTGMAVMSAVSEFTF